MPCPFKDAGHNGKDYQGMAMNLDLSRFGCNPMIVATIEIYLLIIN